MKELNIYLKDKESDLHIKRYVRFIETRSNRELSGNYHTEKHHILPKSLGGSNDSENLIVLTDREHFIAHLILWKAFGGKMTYAFWIMNHSAYKDKYPRLNSRQYEILRTTYRQEVSKKTNTSKKLPSCSKEASANYRRSALARPKKECPICGGLIPNPNFSRHLKSCKKKQAKKSDEKEGHWNKGNTATKGRININNGITNKYIYPNELAKYQNEGWVKGRFLTPSQIAKRKEDSSKTHTGKTTSDKTKAKLRNSQKNRRAIYRGITNKSVKPEELQSYLNEGWRLGQIQRHSVVGSLEKSIVDAIRKYKEDNPNSTQQEIGDKFNISRGTIGRILNYKDIYSNQENKLL